jgi:hypothetical protein
MTVATRSMGEIRAATAPPEIPGSTFQPVPPGYVAGPTVGWLLTGAIMVLAGGALIWGITRWVRHREDLPVLMWVGALVAVVAEPMLDLLCHIWYATDLPLTVVSGWGVKVPLLVPLAWAFFVGMTGYVAYRRMLVGMSVRAVFALLGAYMLLDIALEYPAIIGNAWTYYGHHPLMLFGFGLWMTWINATGMIIGGFLAWVLEPRVTGVWRPVLLLCPGAGYLMSWTVLSFPNYLAMEWDPPTPALLALSLLSLVFCLLVVRGIAACGAPGASTFLPARPADTDARPAEATA